MTTVEIIMGIALIVMSLVIAVLVMLQPGKDKRLSGAISGGASDTFFGKSAAHRREKQLEKATVIVAVVFFIAIVALFCIVK